jgi:chromosome segregation ATPase
MKNQCKIGLPNFPSNDQIIAMQDAPYLNEPQLLLEVSQLREQFPHTQDLYREVCTVLFFRHGITPTTNKLYQLVRKGSMSAPAEALTKFWQDLREKSRVRIEHPDLPEAVKNAAGEMTAALWTQSLASAQESLAAYRDQAQARALAAESGQAAAEVRLQAAIENVQHAGEELRVVRQHVQELGQQLAASGATTAALEVQLRQAQQDNEVHQQRLAEARREFSAELDKLRSAAVLAEERMAAAEKRALLEIDRERTLAVLAQKNLEASRTRASATADKARADIAALQHQLGDQREQNGKLEGHLQALNANRDQLAGEIGALRDSLAAAERSIIELRQTAIKPARATLRKMSSKKPPPTKPVKSS